jgi:O-acetyl-ADP-ribose deacetylase (regulator of RNase III)
LEVKIVQGDLFDSPDRAIGHGVNVFGMMGSGIALPMRKRFSLMHAIYVDDCLSGRLTPGRATVTRDTDTLTFRDRLIVNIASQDQPGPSARYDWLAYGLDEALRKLTHLGETRLSLPKIGCGIGGLDWLAVEQIIRLVERAHPGFTITVYSLD